MSITNYWLILIRLSSFSKNKSSFIIPGSLSRIYSNISYSYSSSYPAFSNISLIIISYGKQGFNIGDSKKNGNGVRIWSSSISISSGVGIKISGYVLQK